VDVCVSVLQLDATPTDARDTMRGTTVANALGRGRLGVGWLVRDEAGNTFGVQRVDCWGMSPVQRRHCKREVRLLEHPHVVTMQAELEYPHVVTVQAVLEHPHVVTVQAEKKSIAERRGMLVPPITTKCVQRPKSKLVTNLQRLMFWKT